ncbi:MAG: hypothetical protein QM689_04490 [Oscillospiraceae bacterium]
MKNKSVREYAKRNGVFLWQVAAYLNISEPTMTRRLRTELTESEKSEIFAAVNSLKTQKETA